MMYEFSLDFDCLFSTVDLNSFSHFVIDNNELLVVAICVVQFRGNHTHNFKSTSHSADLKSLTRLLLELYSTQPTINDQASDLKLKTQLPLNCTTQSPNCVSNKYARTSGVKNLTSGHITLLINTQSANCH